MLERACDSGAGDDGDTVREQHRARVEVHGIVPAQTTRMPR